LILSHSRSPSQLHSLEDSNLLHPAPGLPIAVLRLASIST
jgi:hypothetical protein